MYKQYIEKLQNLSDYSFVITAGPTREWLDPFRFITNPSSGKMGIALAQAALSITQHVTLIHGNIDTGMPIPSVEETVKVETTQQMLEAVLNHVTHNSILIMAAAPTDFRPSHVSKNKIKKAGKKLSVEFTSTPDILKTTAEHVKKMDIRKNIRVGFAAETTNTHAYAKNKLYEKELDYICLNDISKEGSGFRFDTNEITMFKRDGVGIHLCMKEKQELAYEILSVLAQEVGRCM